MINSLTLFYAMILRLIKSVKNFKLVQYDFEREDKISTYQ